MLAAEQLLPIQAEWVSLPSVHDKNHSYWAPAELARMPIKVNTLTFWLTCLSSGTGVGGCGTNHTIAKQTLFSSLSLFHAYMQSSSFSISNLVLAVPSTEILKWITDFHTSKQIV
jgi:hypothetical protein